MIRRFSTSLRQKGATLVEYGIMVGLVAVVTIAAVALTGQTVNDSFEATDQRLSSAQTATQAPSAPAGGLTLAASAIPDAVENGVAVNFDFNTLIGTTGGYSPGTITWSVTGALPPGIVLNPVTGVLSGTYADTGGAAGTTAFPFTVQATDGVRTVSRAYTINGTEVM